MRWFAFLRGINVGGRRITVSELVDVATRAGLAAAASYQASGNLIANSELDREAIQSTLGATFESERGWHVDVFARTGDELRATLAASPFPAAVLDRLGKPQIGFAHRAVDVAAPRPERDLVAMMGHEIHWVPHTGVSEADLSMADFEQLGGPVTFRTRATVQRLVERFG